MSIIWTRLKETIELLVEIIVGTKACPLAAILNFPEFGLDNPYPLEGLNSKMMSSGLLLTKNESSVDTADPTDLAQTLRRQLEN